MSSNKRGVLLSKKVVKMEEVHYAISEMAQWKCNVCQKVLISKKNLNSHYKIHSGEKKYRCDICNKTFRWWITFKRHINTHADERPYSCSYCDAKFKRTDNRKKHERRKHTPNKICRICGKTFSKYSLKLHKEKGNCRSTDKVIFCKLCNKVFVDSQGLFDHQLKSHPQETKQQTNMVLQQEEEISFKTDAEDQAGQSKLFSCQLCHYANPKLAKLMVHLANHEKGKLYKCDHCDTNCQSKRLLIKHIRDHFNGETFFCKICQKTFVHERSFQDHMNKHTEKKFKIFKCDLCSKSYSSHGGLMYHKKGKHRQQPRNKIGPENQAGLLDKDKVIKVEPDDQAELLETFEIYKVEPEDQTELLETYRLNIDEPEGQAELKDKDRLFKIGPNAQAKSLETFDI